MTTNPEILVDAHQGLSGLESLYASLLNGIDDHAIYALDAHGRILTWNAGAERVKGWSAADVLGREVAIFYTADDIEAGAPRAHLTDAETTGRSDVEGWRVRHDGTRYWAHVVTTPLREDGSLTGFARVTRDLTASRTAANALRESEARFRRAFDDAAIGMSITAADGGWIQVNPALCSMLGYTRSELLQSDFQSVTHPDDLASSAGMMFEALAGNADHYALEKRYLHKAGRVVWARINVVVVHERPNSDPYFVTQMLDITEQREAQLALEASEAKFRSLSVSSPVGIFQSDATGSITYANPRLLHIFDMTKSEGLGYGWLDRLHPDDRGAVMSGWAAALAAQVEYSHEYRLVLPDGSIRWVRCHAAPLRDVEGCAGTVGTVQDVTERTMLELQLRQAQKLEAVGRLAGGIAHDFNNLLTVISGNLAFARADLSQDGAAAQDLAHAELAAARAADLTRQLLAFSRQQVLAPRRLDLNASVRDVCSMLSRVVGDAVILDTDLSAETCMVHVDPGQLEQVLMNLVMNARDAMPVGGTIRIATGSRELDDRHFNMDGGLPEGRYAFLVVEDEGTGISAEALPHVFDPFFTTKEIGRGTGLGLATVYGIVAQSGGRVVAESEPGAGSCFTVFLPHAENEATGPDSPELEQSGGGDACILLVDDNAAVSDVVARMLTSAGYAVVRASNGLEALEIISSTHMRRKNHPGDRVDLVLTDLEMPHMGGIELMERLAELWPQQRILLMTGYARPAEISETGTTHSILQKPFSKTDLLECVRDVLAGRACPG